MDRIIAGAGETEEGAILKAADTMVITRVCLHFL